jgi:hypothetical protein
VVLTRAFDLLPAWSKALHALALGLVALCTILLMAPAAYHRTVYAGEAAPELHQLGSKFILVATMALALGLAADVYVVIARIAEKLSGLPPRCWLSSRWSRCGTSHPSFSFGSVILRRGPRGSLEQWLARRVETPRQRLREVRDGTAATIELSQ